MKPGINPNCVGCSVAIRFNADASNVVAEATAQSNRVEYSETGLRISQSNHRARQTLAAIELTDDFDENVPLAPGVSGPELPDASILFAMRTSLDGMKERARQLELEADYAVSKSNDLMSGCDGPRTLNLGGLYISLCSGNLPVFRSRVFISRKKPIKLDT